MNEIQLSLKISKIDWKWVGIGYCFFVVFHLLPTYIVNGFYMSMEDTAGRGIWLLVGLVIIAFYIGFRSRGVTILEPAISVLLYDVTLLLAFRELWASTVSYSWGMIFVLGFITLVLAICSAWMGELFQAKKKAKANKGT
jgi:hypothetical protein